jgi:hypothetical protein
LLVRGLENIAKAFLFSFFAVALWPIVFLVSGLVTQLLIGLAVNTGNVSGSGAANGAGMTYLWMICVAGWVIFSSIFGPWIISRRFVAGATGMADMLVGDIRWPVRSTISAATQPAERWAGSTVLVRFRRKPARE